MSRPPLEQKARLHVCEKQDPSSIIHHPSYVAPDLFAKPTKLECTNSLRPTVTSIFRGLVAGEPEKIDTGVTVSKYRLDLTSFLIIRSLFVDGNHMIY